MQKETCLPHAYSSVKLDLTNCKVYAPCAAAPGVRRDHRHARHAAVAAAGARQHGGGVRRRAGGPLLAARHPAQGDPVAVDWMRLNHLLRGRSRSKPSFGTHDPRGG